MQNNQYYEALLEGRYQPRIDVKRLDNGDYRASFESPAGVKVEFVDSDQAEAFRRCNDQVVEGIKDGKIHPFV